MNTPAVSVLMPVYNADKFLNQAINSILNQTFVDFEFIIINDGSQDKTKEIINNYRDARIVYLENSTNEGLVYSLNKGISAAKGKYIARMDADDIALKDRLQMQVGFFELNVNTLVLATTIKLINENNENIGYWSHDIQHISPESIRGFLPVNNCIAHPTVMIKADVLKKYKYNISQKLSEDYDLWLRLSADKIAIYKLKEPLLLHRILQTSFTRTTGKNLFFKLMTVKFRFVVQQLRKGELTGFVLKIFMAALFDCLKGIGKAIKKVVLSKNV